MILENNSIVILDTETLQQAINRACSANTTLELKPVTYNLTSSVTVDLSKCRIKGNGAKLNFSTAPTGLNCIKIICSNANPYQQNANYIENLEIIGRGSSSGQTAICFDSTSPSKATSHLNLRGLNIHEFNIGINYKTFVYLIRHESTDIYNCNTCVYTPDTGADYGENINFYACAFYNSSTAVYHNNPSGSFHFTSCSIDYCSTFINVNSGRVFFTNGHIEGNGQLIGNLNIDNSWIVLPTNDSKTIFCPTNAQDRIIIDKCFISTAKQDKTIASGKGRVIFKDNRYDFTSSIVTNTLNPESMLYPAKEVDIYAISGTSTQSDRYTVQNCMVKKDNSVYETGNFSWKITKQYGVGSNSEFRVLIPKPTHSSRFYIRMRAKSSTTVPINTINVNLRKLYVGTGYYDNPIFPNWLLWEDAGNFPISMSTSWQWYYFSSSTLQFEEKYNYISVDFNMFMWNGSNNSVYIDRIEVFAY